MAQKTVVTLVDDVTGKEVEEGDVGSTIQIGWKGDLWELDVSSATLAGLEEYFDDILHSARLIRGERRTNKGGSKKTKGQRIQRVREWARSQGMEIAERGRINKDVLEAYSLANPQDAESQAA